MLGESLIKQKKKDKDSPHKTDKKNVEGRDKKFKKLIESNNELKRTFFFVIYHFPSQSSFHFDFKSWWSEISGNVKKKKFENCNKIYFSNKTKNAKLISFLFFYSKEEKKVTQKNVSSFFFY